MVIKNILQNFKLSITKIEYQYFMIFFVTEHFTLAFSHFSTFLLKVLIDIVKHSAPSIPSVENNIWRLDV